MGVSTGVQGMKGSQASDSCSRAGREGISHQGRALGSLHCVHASERGVTQPGGNLVVAKTSSFGNAVSSGSGRRPCSFPRGPRRRVTRGLVTRERVTGTPSPTYPSRAQEHVRDRGRGSPLDRLGIVCLLLSPFLHARDGPPALPGDQPEERLYPPSLRPSPGARPNPCVLCSGGAKITISQEGERKAISCSYSRDGRTPGDTCSRLVERVTSALAGALARVGRYLAALAPSSASSAQGASSSHNNNTLDASSRSATTKNNTKSSGKMSGAKKNPPAPALHKVIMVGAGGVGKSALTLQFMYDEVKCCKRPVSPLSSVTIAASQYCPPSAPPPSPIPLSPIAPFPNPPIPFFVPHYPSSVHPHFLLCPPPHTAPPQYPPPHPQFRVGNEAIKNHN
ncbi:putative ras-related protein ralB-A-like [Penaeus vannamei]|uniref:Putative ras-related protein ralB-A-like n=1 Tax=Penaeus vannamei TaxID=6689 RepID=A0A3R7PFB6_PENVA|nr:putative ras-related protein ralB-A-like [Penaeus vannamei]